MSVRVAVSSGLAVAAIASSVAFLPEVGAGVVEDRPNVIVIVTDDQSADTIPRLPAVMPFLQSRALDPQDHWVVFERAFVNTPICCPSRATMLTGLYAHHTGVLDNDDGDVFDETSTLATWMRDAGYHTGLVGKYLNRYPFGRDPFVPQGWDRWWGKIHGPPTSLYYGYTLFEQDHTVDYGSAPADYSTDVLASKAVEFIRESPLDRPFFLWLAPTAPHPPATPAERHAGTFDDLVVPTAPSVGEPDVSDKPAWVRALPRLDAQDIEALRRARRRASETLRAVDDAVRLIVAELRSRGELDETVIAITSDNGLAFGEHRWTRKSCPYEACLRVPFLVRAAGRRTPGRADGRLGRRHRAHDRRPGRRLTAAHLRRREPRDPAGDRVAHRTPRGGVRRAGRGPPDPGVVGASRQTVRVRRARQPENGSCTTCGPTPSSS